MKAPFNFDDQSTLRIHRLDLVYVSTKAGFYDCPDVISMKADAVDLDPCLKVRKDGYEDNYLGPGPGTDITVSSGLWYGSFFNKTLAYLAY